MYPKQSSNISTAGILFVGTPDAEVLLVILELVPSLQPGRTENWFWCLALLESILFRSEKLGSCSGHLKVKILPLHRRLLSTLKTCESRNRSVFASIAGPSAGFLLLTRAQVSTGRSRRLRI